MKKKKLQRKRPSESPHMFLITRCWSIAMEDSGVPFKIRLQALNNLARVVVHAYGQLNRRRRKPQRKHRRRAYC